MQTGSPAFVLDTDIGTDVDDLLALALILGSDDLDLRAVTTVYGDVELRARIVAKVFRTAGAPAPSITVGERATRSGREVWWPGHEGETIADLDAQTYSSARDAVSELASARTVVAIGPLTNVATAVERAGHGIERIVMMGGEFAAGVVEHNIRCDVTAADVVFRSGVPILAIGLEQTERIRLRHDDLDRIGRSGPLGALIGAEMRRFWEFADQDYNVPHDPLAVLSLARPDLFEITRGTIELEALGPDEGMTRFTATPDGPHAIVTGMDVGAVADEVLARIVRACSPSPQPSTP